MVRLSLRTVLLLLSFSVLCAVALQAQALQPTAGAMQGTVSIAGESEQPPVSSVLCAVALQAQAVQPTAGAMQGTVSIVGETDQPPVSGATIAVFSEGCVGSTVSDPQGKFSLSGLAPGIYLLEARYLTLRAQQKVRIDAGEIVQIAVQLESSNTTHADQ